MTPPRQFRAVDILDAQELIISRLAVPLDSDDMRTITRRTKALAEQTGWPMRQAALEITNTMTKKESTHHEQPQLDNQLAYRDSTQGRSA